MDEMNITECLQCGGDLKTNPKTGVPTCIYCGREYKDSVGSYSYDLQEIVNRRQMREFIQAEELCKELLHKQPESSEAYWQTLLSTLGVVYVQEEGRAKPTFFSYTYDDRELIKDNEYYKKAIMYARSSENREFYQSKAEELDVLLKEFFNLVAKENSYDIFISFKKTTEAIVDGERRTIDTDDYIKAREIYDSLKDKYKVFFSPVSIGADTGIEGEKYEPRILKALQTSQAMILIGSRKEYLEAQWVENEWRRYQYFIQKGNKQKQSLILGYFRNMPSLPTALKDIQLPSFDMFKGNYLKELRDKLSFVRSSKGLKSVIGERKIKSDFKGEEGQFNFGYNVTRVEITDKGESESIQISATEERDMETAEMMRKNGRFGDSIMVYEQILSKNPNNYRAYWGRFCSRIKAKNNDAVKNNIVFAREADFSDFEQAIHCSSDVNYSWSLVDLLVESLTVKHEWSKQKLTFDILTKYLDDKRVIKVLSLLGNRYVACIKEGKIRQAEEIFACARKLFVEENLSYNIDYMANYAKMLFKYKHYEIAQKYFEELSLARKKVDYYLHLLKCRIKTQVLSTAVFNLTINPNDDASQKKPSELDIDEIIERIIVCEFDEQIPEVRNEMLQTVLYQIQHNKKNAKDHIETIISCYTQLGATEIVEQYLFKISNKYIQINDFKTAKIYYNEILTHNTNCSKAHWGLLKCKLKAFDDADLAKYGKKLMKHQEFNNATNCANNVEYEYYMTVYNGSKQLKTNRPNRQAYLSMTKVQRWLRNAVVSILLLSIIGLSIFTVVGIANPITYEVHNGLATITGTGFFFDYVADELNIENTDGTPIAEIGESAFSGKKIQKVTLGASVQDIGVSSFENCNELGELVINSDALHIREKAFANCVNLSSISFKNEITAIDVYSNAFQNCTSLEKITFINLHSIGKDAFAGCSNLKEIIIDGTESVIISEGAFDNIADGCTVSLSTETGDLYLTIAENYPNLVVKTHTQDAVNECIYLINKIGDVSLNSENAINTAKAKYDNLTNDQKAQVTNAQILNNLISELKVLQTIDAINTISDVSLESEDDIINAESLYSILSVDEKEKVSNINSLSEARKLFDIIKMIDNLGEADDDLLGAIYEIRILYNALTEEEQSKIVNRDKLFMAESNYDVFSVMSAIDNIGVIGLSSEDDIVRAEQAYDLLREEQKTEVTNLSTLTTARAVFDVMVKIDQIGTVSLDNEATIIAAEISYGTLSDTQKELVSNIETLNSARKVFNLMNSIEALATINLESESAIAQCENVYSSLLDGEKNQISNVDKLTSARAVYDLLKKIDSLGVITLDSESLIVDAEQSYSQLTGTQKNSITNYSTLTAARSKYNVLVVIKLIDDIGTVSLDSEDEIVAAESAYSSLTYTQKNQVTNYSTLTDARSKYDILFVVDSINRIGTVSLESKETITTIEQLYAELSDEEKNQVTNYSILTSAREQYDVLATINEINNIGDVSLDSKSQIEKAESCYTALSEDQKKQVTNHATLVEARREFDVLATIQAIDAIGTVTQSSLSLIFEAETAYNNLDDTQKEQITNASKLTEARAYYNYLKQFEFTLNSDDTYSIAAAGTSTDCMLVIPSEYNGKAVTEIEAYGFRDCNNLVKVTIPESITRCLSGAFYDCYKLVEVYKLTSANIYFDSHITVYSSLSEPSSLTEKDNFIFYENEGEYYLIGYTGSSSSLVLPEKYNNEYYTIYKYAFYNNKTIRSLTLPFLVKDIQHNAFAGCTGLSSVCCPAGTLSTGYGIFYNCGLSSFFIEFDYFWGFSWWNSSIRPGMLDESLTSSNWTQKWLVNNITTNALYDYVVSNGNAILTQYKGADTVVVVPSTIDGYTVIGISTAFVNNSEITSVTLPDTIQILNHYAFAFCTKLTKVELPDSLTYIGEMAFYSCTSLTEFTISENVTYIGDNAFGQCTKLATINYKATDLKQGALSKCGENAVVNIAANVKSIPEGFFSNRSIKIVNFETNSICKVIGDSAFYNCSSLTTINLPSILKSIGSSAFSGCSALTEITIPENVTEIGVSAFANCTQLSSVVFDDYNNWKRQDYSVTLSISNTLLQDASSAANALVTQYAQYTFIKEQ